MFHKTTKQMCFDWIIRPESNRSKDEPPLEASGSLYALSEFRNLGPSCCENVYAWQWDIASESDLFGTLLANGFASGSPTNFNSLENIGKSMLSSLSESVDVVRRQLDETLTVETWSSRFVAFPLQIIHVSLFWTRVTKMHFTLIQLSAF